MDTPQPSTTEDIVKQKTMREIKFRAWDSYNKIMINPFCELKDNRFWGEDCTNTGYAPSDIMQYTGLKDKNGKEIYEGDIVRHLSNINHWQVEWFKNAWRYNRIFLLHEISPVEVIGNIYQTPELLK